MHKMAYGGNYFIISQALSARLAVHALLLILMPRGFQVVYVLQSYYAMCNILYYYETAY